MQLKQLACILLVAPLFLGCTSKLPVAHSEETSGKTPPPAIPPRLKGAIEELRVMKIKIETGINPKEYGEDLADLVPMVENSTGDAKVLASVKSAVAGHQLAVQFFQCDRVNGYDAMYQCRDNVLKAVFSKYPDIATKAKAATEGENLSHISAGLDKDAVLQAIWEKTGIDTEAALQVSNPSLLPQLPKHKK
ncbi:hypothetical protein [Limnofasciculus baicalensis]|uniref:hypothetical protein n=1 Tax=Limnofasciculus baicalensis TaxID=3064906 RepID=UPI0020A7BAAB|nr:hypothetical protein [Limnofasciculus baicalensis]